MTQQKNFRGDKMKFEIPETELKKYESLDIIAASLDPVDPTQPTTDPQFGTDPFQDDKW